MKKTCLALCLSLCVVPAHAAAESYACLIEPYQKVELRSPVEALIKTIRVDRGAVVRRDQVLVELDTGVEEAALAAAKYRAVMEGQVRSAATRVDYSRSKLKRRQELVRQNFISDQERDDADSELRLAEAELLDAKDNRELAVLEERRLAALLEQRRLRSPFNGVVMERMQHPGELAQTGEGARAILKLAQTNPLRVEVVLPTSLYGRIRNGMRAEVSVEQPLKGIHSATVRIVDKVIDSASGTFGVRLDLANPKGDIPAGVKCRVKF
ncbi:MAG: efflux RND transporter periplasmic adaptor subunit [Pseudomonadota bacterium]